jgi:Arf-GAP/SH3 domain/ANK repeat/PH domain-containing protein
MSMNGFASIGGTSNTSIDSAKSPGSVSTGGTTITSPREVNKFKGFRDLEEKDYQSAGNDGNGTERKEGLLWALSRPGSHADPKGLNKQAWHK